LKTGSKWQSNSLHTFYKLFWYHNTIFLLRAQIQMKNPTASKKITPGKNGDCQNADIVLGEINEKLFLVCLLHKNLGIQAI